MKKRFCIFLICTLIFTTTLGLWCIDIGYSGMVTQAQVDTDLSITNGFWTRPSIQQYHIGMMMVIVSMISLAGLSITGIEEGFDFQEN